jgi:hypothetical protein
MSARRLTFALLAGAVLLLGATVQACSLNPQPLPPGDQPDGGAFGAADATAASADGGTDLGAGGDASAHSDAGDQGVPPTNGESDSGVVDGARDAATTDAPEGDGGESDGMTEE